MKKIIALIVTALLFTTTASATTPVIKIIDQIQATGGSLVNTPTSGSAFLSDTNTVTGITNKSFSGITISGTGTITTGTDFVDTSDATKKLAFSLSGMTTAKTLTFTFSQTNSESVAFPNVSSGDSVATLNATQTFGAGSTWNGQVIGAAYGGASTSVNNSVASPQSVSATGITISSPTFDNIVFAKGATPASTVTVTSTPSITACTAAGQTLTIVSESSTALFTLQNQGDLASSQLQLNGPWTSGMNNGTPYVLHLKCDNTASTPNWVEVSRNN